MRSLRDFAPVAAPPFTFQDATRALSSPIRPEYGSRSPALVSRRKDNLARRSQPHSAKNSRHLVDESRSRLLSLKIPWSKVNKPMGHQPMALSGQLFRSDCPLFLLNHLSRRRSSRVSAILKRKTPGISTRRSKLLFGCSHYLAQHRKPVRKPSREPSPESTRRTGLA